MDKSVTPPTIGNLSYKTTLEKNDDYNYVILRDLEREHGFFIRSTPSATRDNKLATITHDGLDVSSD